MSARDELVRYTGGGSSEDSSEQQEQSGGESPTPEDVQQVNDGPPAPSGSQSESVPDDVDRVNGRQSQSAGSSGAGQQPPESNSDNDLPRPSEATGRDEPEEFRRDSVRRDVAEAVRNRGEQAGAAVGERVAGLLDADSASERVIEGVGRQTGGAPGAAALLAVNAEDATRDVLREGVTDGPGDAADQAADLAVSAGDSVVSGVDRTFDIDFSRRRRGEGAAIEFNDAGRRDEQTAAALTAGALALGLGGPVSAGARGAAGATRGFLRRGDTSRGQADFGSSGRNRGGSAEDDGDQLVLTRERTEERSAPDEDLRDVVDEGAETADSPVDDLRTQPGETEVRRPTQDPVDEAIRQAEETLQEAERRLNSEGPDFDAALSREDARLRARDRLPPESAFRSRRAYQREIERVADRLQSGSAADVGAAAATSAGTQAETGADAVAASQTEATAIDTFGTSRFGGAQDSQQDLVSDQDLDKITDQTTTQNSTQDIIQDTTQDTDQDTTTDTDQDTTTTNDDQLVDEPESLISDPPTVAGPPKSGPPQQSPPSADPPVFDPPEVRFGSRRRLIANSDRSRPRRRPDLPEDGFEPLAFDDDDDDSEPAQRRGPEAPLAVGFGAETFTAFATGAFGERTLASGADEPSLAGELPTETLADPTAEEAESLAAIGEQFFTGFGVDDDA